MKKMWFSIAIACHSYVSLPEGIFHSKWTLRCYQYPAGGLGFLCSVRLWDEDKRDKQSPRLLSFLLKDTEAGRGAAMGHGQRLRLVWEPWLPAYFRKPFSAPCSAPFSIEDGAEKSWDFVNHQISLLRTPRRTGELRCLGHASGGEIVTFRYI